MTSVWVGGVFLSRWLGASSKTGGTVTVVGVMVAETGVGMRAVGVVVTTADGDIARLGLMGWGCEGEGR